MNQVRPKQPRLRLDPEYEELRNQCYVATAGDVSCAALGPTSKSGGANMRMKLANASMSEMTAGFEMPLELPVVEGLVLPVRQSRSV